MGPVRCHALRVLVHVLSSTGCLPFSIKFLALSAPSRMHFLPLIHHTIALPPPNIRAPRSLVGLVRRLSSTSPVPDSEHQCAHHSITHNPQRAAVGPL
ncbi:hypothetical protein LXA43DRAFT_391175 [Ganoderma leucocontextum]|nr:hypothetical protein LXA43DRAFT_391175 [Ganoderma leucocontextum]